MIKAKINPNTFTLFALLIGCKKSNDYTISNQIWTDLVICHKIEPDLNCYQTNVKCIK